jgi:dihydropteroate synthase
MDAMGISWRMKDRLVEPRFPTIMGILNATPDSFFGGSRAQAVDAALERTERLLAEGAGIIDVGGASSRPGAEDVPKTRSCGV